MEDRDRILDYTKLVRLPDDCKVRKNFTQGYFYREIGRYKNAVPSEFQWAAEDKLINKSTYEELRCQLPDYPRSTFLMVFSPDGKKVASTHGNHNVYVTDLTTGKNIQTLSGHPRTPWCIAFHPSSNQILASGCLGGQVRVWDLHGGSEVWTAESQTVIASLAFHPVDRMLVIATYNELHFWDWSQPEPFAKCSTKSEREKVRYVSFDPLGSKLITGIANPVNVYSQWDRVNVVNSQPPTTMTTTSSITTPPTTVSTTMSSTDLRRSITFCYRHLMNQYTQLVNRYRDLSRSRITPTIDRGTDPMDLLDLRSNGNNPESSTNNATPSTSYSATNSSSPLRVKNTRSACRSYRSLSSLERFRIQSSVFSRFSNRPSVSSSSLATTTTSSTVSQSSVFTTPPSLSTSAAPSSPPAPRVYSCAFGLGPMCLTLSPENSSTLFSFRNTSQSTSASGAITNPTYTSSERGIFSTRESTSNSTAQRTSQAESHGSPSSSNRIQLEPRSYNTEQPEILRASRRNFAVNWAESLRSSSRDSLLCPLEDVEIERELQRSSTGTFSRRQEPESSTSAQRNSPGGGESSSSDFYRNVRPSSRFQLTPVDLRNVSPVRRFREELSSEGGLTGSSRRDNQSLSQSLMHPRPVPRIQLRSRSLQDQQSQLQLITNRETHGINLQNNQSLRRQLSFRPGGQFVLSRHSNSPFQPRVPHHIDSPTQVNSSTTMKNNSKTLRPEIPSLRTSFTTSVSSNSSESSTSTPSSSGNVLFLNSNSNNLSFTGEGTSTRQLPEQHSSRRLLVHSDRPMFVRVKMTLRDRVRNFADNASTDSTINYSRISGESEADAHNLIDTSLESEESNSSRGLGPRGADPMLSSASENLDTSNDALLLPNSEDSSPVSANADGASSNNNSSNMAQSDLLDPWECETDTGPFSLSSPLSLNDVLSEQPQTSHQATSQGADNLYQSEGTSASHNDSADNPNPSSSEFNMRSQLQKIRGVREELTNRIRYLHHLIQNRATREASTSSTPNDISNSGDVPSIRNLAISTSPVPETSSRSSTSSESASEASVINGYKELFEAMFNDLFNDSKKQSSSSSSESKNLLQNIKSLKNKKNSDNNSGSSSTPSNSSSRNETEEPQPGPSGLSTPSASRAVRNFILRKENLKFRVYKLLLDTIQRTRRRREARELGTSASSGLHRQHCFRIRNFSRVRFRSDRHGVHFLDSPTSRSRALNRKLEAILLPWANERNSSRSNQPTPSTSTSDTNQPSTSTAKSSTSDACQSCGQKKKPIREFCRQKKRNADSFSGFGTSASKALKNNVGERSQAPGRSDTNEEQSQPSSSQVPSTSSTRSTQSSTNELLKEMIQTLGTMLGFPQELTGEQSRRQSSLSLPSSSDDSDSDQNDSNEQSGLFMRNFPRNFRCTQEVIGNLKADVTHLRIKRLLQFMVQSSTQFFGKIFSILNQVVDEQILSTLDQVSDEQILSTFNQVLDEQIFGLNMLLHLGLELTDLLLDQLNARSRDLERTWSVGNSDMHNVERSYRNWLLSRPSRVARRMRERSRNFGRSSYNPPYGASREDSSHSRLISTRLNTSGYCRRKRTTARMSTSLPSGWYSRSRRILSQSNNSSSSSMSPGRTLNGSSMGSRYRSFRFDRRSNGEESSSYAAGLRAFDYEINNNHNSNDTNNNNNLNDDRNNNNNNNININNNNSNRRNNGSASNNSDISSNNNNNNSSNNNNNNNVNNNNFVNYYFANNSTSSNSDNSNNNIIIVTGLNSGNDAGNHSNSNNSNSDSRNSNNDVNTRQSGSYFLSQYPLPTLRPMELTQSRNESGDLSLRDERPIFWIQYGTNSESSTPSNIIDSQSGVSSFTVPVVQVNDVPVPDVSMLNQPRHRPLSPVQRVAEDIWRWRAWRPRFLHPRNIGLNPFDDQDSNDVPENVHYYRTGPHLGVYTFDPMIITDAPLSPHHRIQAWDFSKMNIPDISDREANGVVPECKIHNDASVDVSNDGHLLVTLLPSGRPSVTTILGVYSLDWSSLGQLLYTTSVEQNAVSVSLSPTNRHLLVGLASRPVVVRDRTNMAQIFRLEGGRPLPQGESWENGRGRLVHMRDLEQTRETNIMSLNCIRWAPGAGQGLVYGTNTGQLKVLR